MTPATSLNRRLILAATAFIAAALVLATIAIGFVLHRFVQGQIDGRLDAHLVFLQSLLRTEPDGSLSLAGDANGPPFDRADSGWSWQVAGPHNTLRSRALGGDDLQAPPAKPPPHPRPDPHGESGGAGKPPREARPLPADGQGPHGRALHYRVLDVPVGAERATIVVAAPRDAVLHPLGEAMATLAVSLGVLALGLIGATFLQVRLGLRPLVALRASLGAVRAGRAARLPEDQPAEILPLVVDLNALFAQNDANLERARRHVANLAHGLKTPLATLSIVLADHDRSGSPEALALVDAMEDRIRHHLGRARMAALDGPRRARSALAPAVAGVLAVLRKVGAGKALDVAVDVAADLEVACEQQDVDEILGNILENAWKWATCRLAITARTAPRQSVVLLVEDDGAGMTDAQRATLLLPGTRLDETVPGFGFGLPIARELVELYGGTVSLARSKWGGLRVEIVLPAAIMETGSPARSAPGATNNKRRLSRAG